MRVAPNSLGGAALTRRVALAAIAVASLVWAPSALATHGGAYTQPLDSTSQLYAYGTNLWSGHVGPLSSWVMGASHFQSYRDGWEQDLASPYPYSSVTNPAAFDGVMNESAAYGLLPAPLLYRFNPAITAPRDDSQNLYFAIYASHMVKRYGPILGNYPTTTGDYWRDRGCSRAGFGPVVGCTIPYRPIRTWEIWNEPNRGYFWASPNAAQYRNTLEAAHTFMRYVDPYARVLFGGMNWDVSQPDTGTFQPPSFYNDAITDATRCTFDAVAAHPYAPDGDKSIDYIRDLRIEMNNGDDHAEQAQIWPNEFGWDLSVPGAGPGLGPPNPFAAASEGVQEVHRDTLVQRMKAERYSWQIGAQSYFALLDGKQTPYFDRLYYTGLYPWQDNAPARVAYWGHHTDAKDATYIDLPPVRNC